MIFSKTILYFSEYFAKSLLNSYNILGELVRELANLFAENEANVSETQKAKWFCEQLFVFQFGTAEKLRREHTPVTEPKSKTKLCHQFG